MMCCSLNPATAEAHPIRPFIYLHTDQAIGTVTPRHRRRPFPPFPSLPPRHPSGLPRRRGPRDLSDSLARSGRCPRGLLAPVCLVDSFSGSGVLFDMSFKSFKELGVSAERLGSFCKRWMARVQRSGCFFPPSQPLSISLSFLHPSFFLSC